MKLELLIRLTGPRSVTRTVHVICMQETLDSIREVGGTDGWPWGSERWGYNNYQWYGSRVVITYVIVPMDIDTLSKYGLVLFLTELRAGK